MLTIANQFQIEGALVSCAPYGNGHVNKTYLAATDAGKRYMLQLINRQVFQDIDGLMANIAGVTEYLRARVSDPRGAMQLIPTMDGKSYYRSPDGECYRMYAYVEGTICLDLATTTAEFYQSAIGIGQFLNLLSEYPAHTLTETIPRFHDTPNRIRVLKDAVREDPLGRAKDCRREIDFALAREPEAGTMLDMLHRKELPLRVTHNDTKLNNVLLDQATGQALCVVDLDTVMPGLMGNDFGDSIRFGASSALEDERDLDKVYMRLDYYDAYAEGFLASCGASMTKAERETLPWAAKLMTYECGARFLTDHLLGDSYFRIHRANENLDRCRTQFKLVADMEGKWDKMRL